MIKQVFFSALAVGIISCTSAPKAQQNVPGITNLAPTQQQQLTAKELVPLLEQYNYKKINVDDSLSSVILDRYIKDLDGTRSLFTSADIKDFNRFRTTMDDDFRSGSLSNSFYIYNVYRKRLSEWLAYTLAQLKNPVNANGTKSFAVSRDSLAWLPNQNALQQYWKDKEQYELLRLMAAGSTPAKSVETLTKRYTTIKTQSAQLNSDDAIQTIFNALTESVDPHTNFFNASAATSFNEEMSRSFEGIGARLQMDNDVIKIAEIIPGGPAYKSKQLKAGDRIVAAAQGNGEFVDLIGWRLDLAITKIKGPKGSVVRLKIIPANMPLSATPKVVSLVREKIIMAEQSAQKAVKVINVNGHSYKIGVISIPAFYADFKAYGSGDKNYKSTTRDVKLLLDTLQNKDHINALLIDLRGNGGGSLMEAISLSGLFVGDGPVVQVKDARGRIEVSEDKTAQVAYTGPMGVMVDRLSASASEIFAGAMQDYNRAIIIGTQTYGKGTVQSSLDLARILNPNIIQRIISGLNEKGLNIKVGNSTPPNLGQINLTMAKFYRVTGSSTQHKGVMPDVVFPSFYPLDKIGEDTEPSALPWDTIPSSTFNALPSISNLRAQVISNHKQRMASSTQYQAIQSDLAYLAKLRRINTVTLNQAAIKKERDDLEARNAPLMLLANKSDELKAETTVNEKAKKPADIDFVLDESLHILADMIQLEGK